MQQMCKCVDCLNYTSPARGGWSVVRTALLAPETALLFVGAPACMRHVILSSYELGLQDRLFCLYLEEADIAAGRCEEVVLQGADALLQRLVPRVRVLMIFLTCTDDLLGTDHDVFLKPLNEKYTETRTIVCHMNPIMAESGTPPGVSVQNKLYGLWEGKQHGDAAVNFIGNNIAVQADNELVAGLREHGIRARHISECARFEDFRAMAGSRLNIVAAPAAAPAARRLWERLGMPYVFAPPQYRLEGIEAGVQEVFCALGLATANLSEMKERVHARLRALAKNLCGRPVIIDQGATIAPFGMARLLMEHGVTVSALYLSEWGQGEREDAAFVLAREVHILQPERFVAKARRRVSRAVCIGFEAAYLESSPHVVTLSADGGVYGLSGLLRLAEMIEKAAATEDDKLRELIDESVLVI